MNKITFATCVYSNLKDGSKSRRDRYYCSLKNLLNTGVPFVVFCDPAEESDIRSFVGDMPNLTLVSQDISAKSYHDDWEYLRQKYNHDNRCMELVHNKINWTVDAANISESERVYWIDAGLSYFSLFPNRFLRKVSHNDFQKYTDIEVFTSEWTERLLKKHDDNKIYCISLSTLNCLWVRPLSVDLYGKYNQDYAKHHVIAGLFGGTVSNMKWFQKAYDDKLKEVIEYYKSGKPDNGSFLPVEEVIMNVVVAQNADKFSRDTFDTWYHEDHEPSFDPLKKGKPFYTLFV